MRRDHNISLPIKVYIRGAQPQAEWASRAIRDKFLANPPPLGRKYANEGALGRLHTDHNLIRPVAVHVTHGKGEWSCLPAIEWGPLSNERTGSAIER